MTAKRPAVPGMIMQIFFVLLLSAVGLAPREAGAQINHELIRRIAVFPLKIEQSSDQRLVAAAEEAWWQVREEFTRSRRFLVASKQFLVKSDAFQPRGLLEPADAIILGRLLDAHALVSMQLVNRLARLHVYDGTNGLLLWSRELALHPSITVSDQLPKVVRRLAEEFVASMPYQGFTTVDSLVGTSVFEEAGVKLAMVDFGIQADRNQLGIRTGVQVGDVVQWIRVSGTNAVGPLFQTGGKLSIYAEGKVLRLEQGIATIEILRATSLADLKEYSLVRVPREAERLQAEFAAREHVRTTLTTELVAPELNPMEIVKKERRPLVTTLSWVGSLAAFLLLAF